MITVDYPKCAECEGIIANHAVFLTQDDADGALCDACENAHNENREYCPTCGINTITRDEHMECDYCTFVGKYHIDYPEHDSKEAQNRRNVK